MDEIQKIADEQGWNGDSLLDLVLQFIDQHGHTGRLVSHLRQVQSYENGES